MGSFLRQVSSLEKVRIKDGPELPEIFNKTAFRGERFSYQVVVFTDFFRHEFRLRVEGPCKDWIKLYAVKNAAMDLPIYAFHDPEDYITTEPGVMPDILLPLEEQNGVIQVLKGICASLWVRVDVPEDAPAGEYPITVVAEQITGEQMHGFIETPEVQEILKTTMTLEVLPVELPKQELKYTQWFHADSIADYHHVEVYSEEHWELIDKYMALAKETGINMILLPVITPPLDTKYGVCRTCVQLVDIEKVGDTYHFGFEKMHRWIDLSKKNGMLYYEVSHLFSQWGLKFAPNVRVRENGEDSFLFGWHVPANDPKYHDFLRQFLPALVEELKKAGVAENAYFHLSDEPREVHLEDYKSYSQLIGSLIGDCKRMDALSHVEFYDMGLVDVPCAASSMIKPFLERKLKELWVYYCGCLVSKVSNRSLAAPAYRNRIMGLQMYRTNVQGFLHWGYNYYNSRCSTYHINPYQTTSVDLAFPSGDPFSVYPGENGPILSTRALVFYEGLQDMQVCQLLESIIGREKVEALIDAEAGMELDYENYPKSADYILNLRAKMTEEIRKHLVK